MTLLEILLALFLPPVVVALRKGLGGAFIINLILTLIFWLPGTVHAFYVLTK